MNHTLTKEQLIEKRDSLVERYKELGAEYLQELKKEKLMSKDLKHLNSA